MHAGDMLGMRVQHVLQPQRDQAATCTDNTACMHHHGVHVAVQVLRFMEQCAGGVGYGQNARPLQPLGAGRQLELEDAV